MRKNNEINNAESKIWGSKKTNNPQINLGNTSRIHWKWRKNSTKVEIVDNGEQIMQPLILAVIW